MRTAEAWDLRTCVLARSPWVVPGLPGLTLPVLLAPGSGATCHGDVTPPDPRTGSCRPCGSPRHSEIGPCLQGSPCVPGAWCRLGPSARASWAKTGGRQGKPGRTRGGGRGGSRGRRAVPGTSALGHGDIAVGIGASRQVRGQAGRPSHLLAQAAPPPRAVMEPAALLGYFPQERESVRADGEIRPFAASSSYP